MKSIGQLLIKQREAKRLTLEDVYKFIKIHPKYLEALETDNYSVFEGKVHAKGFLRNYAEFLGLNLNEVMALWRREYESGFEKKKEEKLYQMENIERPKFELTPPVIFSAIIAVLVLSFFGYLFYQYKSYTGVPNLEIIYPENNKVMSTDILDVSGKSDLDSDVFINNQKVILNSDGTFVVTLKLKEGINTISVNAVNKLNKKSEVLRTIVYRPEENKVPIDALKEASQSTESSESTGESSGISGDN